MPNFIAVGHTVRVRRSAGKIGPSRFAFQGH